MRRGWLLSPRPAEDAESGEPSGAAILPFKCRSLDSLHSFGMTEKGSESVDSDPTDSDPTDSDPTDSDPGQSDQSRMKWQV